MALASPRTIVLGTFAFMVFWVLAVFPSFKLLPIGRTAGALAGAVLTVVFQVESPSEAYKSVDLSILGLLFGTMVVSLYLESADMFHYLGNLISWKSSGVLTEFVLKLCRRKNLPPKPFLIALATSANIGSTATPIGNPQNLVIAIQSGISFGRFLVGLLPSMALGILVNIILILLIYWRQLSPVEDLERGGEIALVVGGKDQLTASDSGSRRSSRRSYETASDGYDKRDFPLENTNQAQRSSIGENLEENSIASLQESDPTHKSDGLQGVNEGSPHRQRGFAGDESASPLPIAPKSPSVKPDREVQSRSTPASGSESSSPLFEEKETVREKSKRRFRKCSAYLVTAAMLAALLYGLDLSWTAITAAVALMALDFRDAETCLQKVSYPLLAFFAGMFITVDGFNKTGIPGIFWDSVEPHAHVNSTAGIVILALVVIVLSNVASNVPTVLLLGSRVALSASSSGASVTKAWLILAWTSTVAGNLTLIGSAANLIVSEQARKAKFFGYELTFWSHLMFGFPSTLIVAAVGLPLIKG